MKESAFLAHKDEYPYNLLLAARGETQLELPASLCKDVLMGIEYALTTLKTQHQELLTLKYAQGKPDAVVGECCGLSETELQQAEKAALEALRIPARWGYLQYGVGANLANAARRAYNRGYRKGYWFGYQNGVQDARDNAVKPVSEEDQEGVLLLPVEYLDLTTRAMNVLRYAKKKTIGDVVRCSEEEIRRMRNMGVRTAVQVMRALEKYGIVKTAWNLFA